MSSDFSLTLPQLLARHRRQMVLLVIRDLAFPHNEDDLQPFGAQRPERVGFVGDSRVSPCGAQRGGETKPNRLALGSVGERAKGHQIDRAQRAGSQPV